MEGVQNEYRIKAVVPNNTNEIERVSGHSKRQIVFILTAGIMRNPQYNNRKHESDTLWNVGVTVIDELWRVVGQDVLQNQDSLGVKK